MVNPSAGSESPWTQTPARLNVAVIGTGRVGSVLGAALRRVGHKVVACTAVSELSKLRAESLLPGVPIKQISEAVQACDLLLLTVPDDVLIDLVSGLAQTGSVSPGTFVLHTAGRFGDEVLEPLTAQGCLPLAIHPVMTFTGTSVDLNRLSGCPFAVTTPAQLQPVAQALVVEMGGDPVWVPRQSRGLYHAALTFGANNLMTLVNQTIDLLVKAGIESPSELVAPLFTASLDNALRAGESAVTGPVVRGDVATVKVHIDSLRENQPEVLPSYLALARLTAARALDADRLTVNSAEQLLVVLSDE
ncbi:MAG: DUF2520 domain-containing protein [Actinobacteria bacterium]|nr:DUF2520 domain-containing protein [Actinomycetota bacterium]NBY15749.1 DUF2520 domain-containing protein [Actinomycetota bacterium]